MLQNKDLQTVLCAKAQTSSDYCICKSRGTQIYTNTWKTIWCVQRVGRQSERGVLRFRAWRGLSHLGLTRLGGWVTAGHTAGGTQRPGFRLGQRNTLSLYIHFKTHQTFRGCDWGGKSPPAKHLLILAAAVTSIHSAASEPATSSLACICCNKGLSCRRILGMDLETLSPL